MEVKRIPQSPAQSAVGQAVDPSKQPNHQDKKQDGQGDKGKKKGDQKAEAAATAAPTAPEPEKAWEEANLSRQPIDSETVVEMLNHTGAGTHAKTPYPAKKPTSLPESKLNRKF